MTGSGISRANSHEIRATQTTGITIAKSIRAGLQEVDEESLLKHRSIDVPTPSLKGIDQNNPAMI